MAIKTVYSNLDEEFLFEEFATATTRQEALTKLRGIFEKVIRTKLCLFNIPFIRLVLLCSEKYTITQEQLRILIFINNSDNVFESVDEPTYDYILFQSRQLLEKWLNNHGIIPQSFYKVNSFDSPAELPQVLARENYLKVYVISAHPPDDKKKYARIFCKTTQGENITILLFKPWEQFCINKSFSHGGVLGFYNLKYGEKDYVFICDKNTLMIISPDLILDVTDIKSSIQNINDYIITRLCYTKSTSSKQVVGNIVNKILDDLLLGTEEYSDSMLTKEINGSKFQLALANATVQDVYQDVKYHIENIIKHGLIDIVKSSKLFSIEPTFISTEFGVTGRIDVLCHSQNKTDGDISKIIELKTGKPKDFGAWKTDETQTALYSLMVQNKKSDTTNNVTVFYSKDSVNPYREIPLVYPYSYQESVRIRNEMISFDRKLAGLNFDSFNELLNTICNTKSSVLLERSIEKLKNLKQILDKSSIKYLVINYVTEFISFCERERYFQKMDFASIWTKADFQKTEEFKILGPLKFEKSDFNKSLVELSLNNNESRFREGDICLIYDKNEKISNQQVFKGTIKTISKTGITVALRNADSIKFLTEDKQWMLENDYMDVTMRKHIWALMDFAASDERKQKLILGLEPSSFTEKPLNIKNDKLTSQQKRAICNAINANDYYLIQGPPGTGKTTLLAYLIKELLLDENEILLVTAFTNRAVDEMIYKFITETGMTDSIIRLGSEYSTEFAEYTIPNIIRDISDTEVMSCIKKRRVFFATLSTASYNEILQTIVFTTSIIDEASQIIEPEALSVILRTKKFILVGDEKQLPPVVSQINSDLFIEQMNTDIKCLNDIGINKLDNSLFERLVTIAKCNSWQTFTLLDTQFRMNKTLFQFSNTSFYFSELHSGEKNSSITTDFNEDKKFINNKPLEFFDIVASGEKKKNKKEADTLVRLLEEYYLLNKKHELGYSFGVIAPFRAQVSYIHQELLARDIHDVKVDTVERFQGGEKDIIFITFTAYHYSQILQIQSLQSFGTTLVDRKLNVALTRAKRKLVMFGNADLLAKNSIFNKLISFCKKEKCFN